MQLQKGYGVTEVTPRPLPQPPDTEAGYPLPPPNLQPQFQLFFQQHQPQSLNADPSTFSFRAGMDAHLAGLPSYRPPPSVVVAPQPLRCIHHQEHATPEHPNPSLLWKCDSGIGHPQFHTSTATESQTSDPNYSHFGGLFASKPEFDKQCSQSPGSASEICPENQVMAKRGISTTAASNGNKKKKKKRQKFSTQLERMGGFIEAQLVAHQERLHQRFTAVLDKMETERKVREDTWRAANAQISRAHAAARAREQALASTREALIVSYLEKVTGEKIGLQTGYGEPGPKGRMWENANEYCRKSKGRDDKSKNNECCNSRVPVLEGWDDDVTPLNSCLYNDNADADCEKKNEMLYAMLEIEERTCQLNERDDHHGKKQQHRDDDEDDDADGYNL